MNGQKIWGNWVEKSMRRKMNKILKIINFILKTNFGKEEIPSYPSDFCIIEYSPIALQNNIRDEENKIIYRYITNEFGTILKKYKYTLARVKALMEVYSIPIYDKTKQEPIFPIFGRILPSEVEFSV